MNKAKFTLTASIVAGMLALGTIGAVAADSPGGGRGAGRPADAPAETGVRHDERQAEVAAILGITVEELQAAIANGETPRTLAEAKGIDTTELKPDWAAEGRMKGGKGAHAGAGAMQSAGAGQGAGAGQHGNAGDCPNAE